MEFRPERKSGKLFSITFESTRNIATKMQYNITLFFRNSTQVLDYHRLIESGNTGLQSSRRVVNY